jgi:hypothetical protein
MNCPKCYEPLRIAERQGVEIDYCPECRGVWLDRGELDKILERSMEIERPRSAPEPYYPPQGKPDKYREKPHYDKHYHKKKYKKKHILKEILDILD